MEVVRHDLRASPSRLYGSGVDMEEFLRVDGAVVLLGQVRSELGGPVNPPQVRRESLATSPVWAGVVVGGGATALPDVACSLVTWRRLSCALSRAERASSLALTLLR